MNHKILHEPDFSMLKLNLKANEKVFAESGAMLGKSTNMDVETSIKGGLLKGFKRKVLNNESLFINTFTAQNTPGELLLAPATPGDIEHLKLSGRKYYLQSGSYLASSEGVEIDSKWQGAKSFLAGEQFFMMECKGYGDLWFSTFGAVHLVNVEGSYTVDTGAIVAFEETLDYSIKSVGGLKSLFFSGEGLVCRFSGVGKLYLQTRLPAGFIHWINPFRPTEKSKEQ